MTEFNLDENLSEYVADALNFLCKGYYPDVVVISTKSKFGKGVPDETIIPEMGKTNSILITKDINIHRTKLQYQMCRQHKLGVFFLKLPKGFDKHWEIVKLLINNWREIVEKARNERKPFGYEVPIKGKMKKL
jgi:hypothetical protein